MSERALLKAYQRQEDAEIDRLIAESERRLGAGGGPSRTASVVNTTETASPGPVPRRGLLRSAAGAVVGAPGAVTRGAVGAGMAAGRGAVSVGKMAGEGIANVLVPVQGQ